MTDNAKNLKYIAPYMRNLRSRIDTTHLPASTLIGLNGNPTIETNCVTLHKGTYEFVISEQTFAVSNNYGFVFQCRIPYYKSSDSILYIGGEYQGGLYLINSKLYLWGFEFSLGEYDYLGGELYQMVFDGTYINHFLNGKLLQKSYIGFIGNDLVTNHIWIGFYESAPPFGEPCAPANYDVQITDILFYQSGVSGEDGLKGIDCNSILSTYKTFTNVPENLQNYGIGGDYYHDKLTNKIYGPKLGLCGSMYFDSSEFNPTGPVLPTILNIPNDNDLKMGTGDFTIEWWQYTRPQNTQGDVRIFSIGCYPNYDPDRYWNGSSWETRTNPGASIAVSISGSSDPQTITLWINCSKVHYANDTVTVLGGHNMGTENLYNKWAHIAIVRSNTSGDGLYTVYVNGYSTGATFTGTDNLNDTKSLTIGGEKMYDSNTYDSNTFFSGHITNFRWSKGIARYTNNFDLPILPLGTIDTNTKILLNANDYNGLLTDSTNYEKSVTNLGTVPVSWNSRNPYFGYKTDGNAWEEPIPVFDPPPFIVSLSGTNTVNIFNFANELFNFNSVLVYLTFSTTTDVLEITNLAMVAVNVNSAFTTINYSLVASTSLPSNITLQKFGSILQLVSNDVNVSYPYISVKISVLDSGR